LPGPQPEKTTASQVAGFAAVAIAGAALISWWVAPPHAVELGLGLRHHEADDGFVPHGPRSRARVPRKNSRFGLVVGLAVAAIAVLDLLDRFGIDSGINA